MLGSPMFVKSVAGGCLYSQDLWVLWYPKTRCMLSIYRWIRDSGTPRSWSVFFYLHLNFFLRYEDYVLFIRSTMGECFCICIHILVDVEVPYTCIRVRDWSWSKSELPDLPIPSFWLFANISMVKMFATEQLESRYQDLLKNRDLNNRALDLMSSWCKFLAVCPEF